MALHSMYNSKCKYCVLPVNHHVHATLAICGSCGCLFATEGNVSLLLCHKRLFQALFLTALAWLPAGMPEHITREFFGPNYTSCDKTLPAEFSTKLMEGWSYLEDTQLSAKSAAPSTKSANFLPDEVASNRWQILCPTLFIDWDATISLLTIIMPLYWCTTPCDRHEVNWRR